MHSSPDSDTPPPGVTNWQDRCIQLENQVTVLKEVSALRKSLLELRESETKSLISKLKFLEEAVTEEKKCRSELIKRSETAELECLELKDKLRRNLETLERVNYHHEAQVSILVTNLETSEMKHKMQAEQVEKSEQKSSELTGQVEELNMKIKEKERALRIMDNKVKIACERSQFLSCQVALINELLQEHENKDGPMDFNKIKAIIRQSEDNGNSDVQPVVISGISPTLLADEDDEGVELTCLIDSMETSDKEEEDIPGEESCYKSVDTKNGPKLILSVSRTFIKLKDLILEKKSLQKDLDSLKNLNTKLESKVDRHEHRLYCVTKELNRTWSLVSKLKQQQDKLHNSEAVLKYELKEKRVLLERLKKELLNYREKWRKVREKNSESQTVWQQLRDEFTQRREQSRSESLPLESAIDSIETEVTEVSKETTTD